MSVLRICQLFDWTASNGSVVRCQNFFAAQDFVYAGLRYRFCPFQVSGNMMALGGDSETLTCLFPNEDLVLQVVTGGDGNRNATLKLTNLWLNNQNQPLPGAFPEFYVGSGASFSETTVELRFRAAMDAVNATLPNRILTSENVGILPLDSNISLR